MLALAAVLLAGCATVTPGAFLITVRDADDTVLEQFQFQAGSQSSLEGAMIGMCRVYPDATIVAEQLQTHEQLKELSQFLHQCPPVTPPAPLPP